MDLKSSNSDNENNSIHIFSLTTNKQTKKPRFENFYKYFNQTSTKEVSNKNNSGKREGNIKILTRKKII